MCFEKFLFRIRIQASSFLFRWDDLIELLRCVLPLLGTVRSMTIEAVPRGGRQQPAVRVDRCSRKLGLKLLTYTHSSNFGLAQIRNRPYGHSLTYMGLSVHHFQAFGIR